MKSIWSVANKEIVISLTIYILIFLCYLLLPAPKYHFSIPITFSQGDRPLIKLDIQGRSYNFFFDSGSKYPLEIFEDTLEKLIKTPIDPKISKDVFGHSYQQAAFLISDIRIGQMFFNDVETSLEDADFFLILPSMMLKDLIHKKLFKELLEEHYLILVMFYLIFQTTKYLLAMIKIN